jgi:hypothetical protein
MQIKHIGDEVGCRAFEACGGCGLSLRFRVHMDFATTGYVESFSGATCPGESCWMFEVDSSGVCAPFYRWRLRLTAAGIAACLAALESGSGELDCSRCGSCVEETHQCNCDICREVEVVSTTAP